MNADDSSKIRSALLYQGHVLRIELAAPKANILDLAMIGALSERLAWAEQQPRLKALILCAAGDHFSFGASVEEHQRDQVAQMLPRFHALVEKLCSFGIPSFAVVRGNCLGGGLELVSGCTALFGSPTAKLGQPEVKLAVFAPLGSILLPWRIGGRALELLTSGRTVNAQEALGLGLLHAVTEDPESACLSYVERNLLPLSASSLRFAEKAARASLVQLLRSELPKLEQIYLQELMATADASEGIAAFLAKRPPRYASEGG